MLVSPSNYSWFGLVWFSILGLNTFLQSYPAYAYPAIEREMYHHGDHRRHWFWI